MDSLLSIVQMPAGVPVATVSVGGARNAGLLAVRILAASDPALRERMVGVPGGAHLVGQGQGPDPPAQARDPDRLQRLTEFPMNASLFRCVWMNASLFQSDWMNASLFQ